MHNADLSRALNQITETLPVKPEDLQAAIVGLPLLTLGFNVTPSNFRFVINFHPKPETCGAVNTFVAMVKMVWYKH